MIKQLHSKFSLKLIFILILATANLFLSAQNKYLKFEAQTGTPYSTGANGISTFLYPSGIYSTGFIGSQNINPVSLRPYGISTNFYLPTQIIQTSVGENQTLGGSVHHAIVEDLYDNNFTTGARSQSIGDERSVIIDLGQSITFSNIQVAAIVAANLDGSAIQVSNNGNTWTTVVNQSTGLPITSLTGSSISSLVLISIQPVNARYVRFMKTTGLVDISEFRLLPTVSQSSGTAIGTPINLYDNSVVAAATTASGTDQWVMQDLGCNRTFSSVKLSTVTAADLNGAELQVSTNGNSWTTLNITNNATGASGTTITGVSTVYPITYSFAIQTARYIRVFRSASGILNVSEFQVEPDLTSSSASSLAAAGTRLTINNTSFIDGFITTATAGQWVQVNLGASYTFSHVQLSTSTAASLNGCDIQTSLDGVSWTTQITNISNASTTALVDYVFPAAVAAQYVRVIRPSGTNAVAVSEFIVSPGVTASSGVKPPVANFGGLYDNAIAAAVTTTSAANQYIMLDLGANKSFSMVQISAATNVANLDGAELQVSTDGISWTSLSFVNNATGVSGTSFSGSSIVYPITYTFTPQTARYVRVFRSAIGVLSLGEFRVSPGVFQSSATSLANNAIATQFNDLNFATGALSSTVSGVNQFVGLNFGEIKTFSHITVGAHTAIANINGATLQVSNDGVSWTTVSGLVDITTGTTNSTIVNVVAGTPRSFSFSAQTAQYIRLIKLDGSVIGVSEFRVGALVTQSSGTSFGTIVNLNDNSTAAAALTATGTEQWVQIDLGTTYNVNFVKMATSGVVANMDGAVLQYSTNGNTWTTITTTNTRTGSTGATLSGSSTTIPTIYSFSTVAARYFRVFRAASGVIAVSEFQVSTGVYQSSGTILATAANLYDNNYASNAVTTLQGNSTYPAFIGINLGTSQTFSKVELSTTNIVQLNGATLEHSNDFINWTTLISSISGMVANQSNTISFPTVTARYIRIRSNSTILSVTEMKVLEGNSDVSTRLINPAITIGTSVVTPIGFNFNFKGVNYTNFSVNADGLLRLGNTIVTVESINNTVSIANNPILYAYWDDIALGNAITNGGVTKTITGTVPNRKMIVEWRAINSTVTGATNLVFQIVLHETTNKIEYVYVNGQDNTTDASIGMAVGTVADVTRLFYSITPNTTLANTTYSNMTPNDRVRLWPGNGTIYSFTPIDLPTSAVVPTDFISLDNAMGAINWAGAPNTGGYSVIVNGGYTEKAANAYATTPTGTSWVKVAGLLLQASGTAANPISFSWNGSGAKPVISNGVGVGGIDYIIGLAGSDFVTIDGFDLQDTTVHTSAFNATQHTTANNLHAEIGIGLFKQRYNTSLGNNGCNNVIIKNCNIDLTRWPNTHVNYVFDNWYAPSETKWTRGIYATPRTASGLGPDLSTYPVFAYNRSAGIISQNDVHQNCEIIGNTINDCSRGIEWDDAYLKSGSNVFAGTNNIIGKNGNGNTITNWGPQPNAYTSNTAAYNYTTNTGWGGGSYMAGIAISGQKDFTVEHNSISGAVSENGTIAAPTTTTSAIMNYIGILAGRTGVNQGFPQNANGFFVNINNNSISNIDVTTTNSQKSVYGIMFGAAYEWIYSNTTSINTTTAGASNGNVNINGNTISNLKGMSGHVSGIATKMIWGTGFAAQWAESYSNLGWEGREYSLFNTNGDFNIKNNTIKQLVQTGNNTYLGVFSGSLTGIMYCATAKNTYIEDNIIGGNGSDGFVAGSVTNAFIIPNQVGLRGILVDRSPRSTITPLLLSVKGNTITNLDRLAGTITSFANQWSAGASAITVYNGAASNIIENNTITGMDIANGLYASQVNTDLDVIYAFGRPRSGNSTMIVRNNSITNITRNQFGFLTSMAAGSGLNASTRGIRADFNALNQSKTINGNTIDGITQTATYTTTAAQQNTFFTRIIGIDVLGRDAIGDQTNIFDNVVTNLSGDNWNSTGTLTTSAYTNPYSVTGINARNGQFINIYNNRVCGLTTNLSASTLTDYTANVKGIAGITIGKTSETAAATRTTLGESVYNNFVSELTAPNIGEELAIEGIVYWGSGRFARIAHNTIVLGDPAGGTSGRLSTTGNTFGVNGLSINNVNFNTTAYPTIIRNNIISINATAIGSTGTTAYSASTTGGFNTAWRTPHSTINRKPLGIDNSTGGNIYFINDDIRNYIYAQGITSTQSRYYFSGLRNAYGYYNSAPSSYVNATYNLKNDVVNAGKFFNTQCGLYKSFWGSPERTSFIDIDGSNNFLALPFVGTGTNCEDKLKISSTATSNIVTASRPVGSPLNITNDYFGTTRNTIDATSGAHAAPNGATGATQSIIRFDFEPICNGVCEANRSLVVSITPPDGKSITSNLSDVEIPRVYYRRIWNNNAFSNVSSGTTPPSTAIVDNNWFYRDGLNNSSGPSGWRFVKPSSVTGNLYTFNIDESLFSGSNAANQVIPSYTIEYFVIATTTDQTVTSWSSGDLSFACPTSVVLNNATTGTTTVIGPYDDDASPSAYNIAAPSTSALNHATASIEGNSVVDKYTIFRGSDLTRTITVGNSGLSYDATSTIAYTASAVIVPICAGENAEFKVHYKVTATNEDLDTNCLSYTLQVADDVSFTTNLQTVTQLRNPFFVYPLANAGNKFFRVWLDCGGTNAAITNTQIIQFSVTDCPTNTTPAIADKSSCVGVSQSVTVTTSTTGIAKFFWAVNPYGKPYVNAPTASTTAATSATLNIVPTNEDESGVWTTYVTNTSGNTVLNGIIPSTRYFDASTNTFNTNGGTNDIGKGTAFTITKFIKLNAVSLIGATGDASVTSGYNIKLFGKNGQLIYNQVGSNIADNSAVQVNLNNWFLAPGDYVIAIDETTPGNSITGSLASVSIDGPVRFTNTSTPSIIVQGGVDSPTDFDNANPNIAHYFVDWDFTEYCTSLTGNTQFNYNVLKVPVLSVNLPDTVTLCAVYDTLSLAPDSVKGNQVTYQWQFASASTFTNIIGQTDSILNITSISSSNSGLYRLVVTGTCGTPVISDTVVVVVNAAPITPTVEDLTICGVPASNVILTSDDINTIYYESPLKIGLLGDGQVLNLGTLNSKDTIYAFSMDKETGCYSVPNEVFINAISLFSLPSTVGEHKADDFCIDESGWAHFFKTTDKQLIFSMQLSPSLLGTSLITSGWNITSSDFEVIAGVESSRKLLAKGNPAYVENANGWYVMRRYWKVNTNETTYTSNTADVPVKMYFNESDFSNLNSAPVNMSSVSSMKLYKLPHGFDPALANHGNAPTVDTFILSNVPGGSLSEYYLDSFITGNKVYVASYHVSGFSGGGGGAGGSCIGCTVLPITLSSINSNCDNNSITLNWMSVSEFNSSHFEVQRSINGKEWISLGNVIALGNSYRNQEYSFKDDNLSLETNVFYYRLKLVDIDGSYTYSKVIRSQCNSLYNSTLIFYPNPIQDELTILKSSDFIGKIKIFDTSGKEVYSNTINSLIGTINTSEWAPGVYVVKSDAYVFKIVK